MREMAGGFTNPTSDYVMSEVRRVREGGEIMREVRKRCK